MLREIEDMVKDNSLNVMTEIVDDQLILTVAWVNSGYHDDEVDRDWKVDELFEMENLIKENHNVSIKDNETTTWDDEKESLIVTINH